MSLGPEGDRRLELDTTRMIATSTHWKSHRDHAPWSWQHRCRVYGGSALGLSAMVAWALLARFTPEMLGPPAALAAANAALDAANETCEPTVPFDEPLSMPTTSGAVYEIPPLPRASSAYSYAHENAFVALPPACVSAHGLAPNAAAAGSVPNTLWVGRLQELPAATPLNALRCGCGWAIFLHGSGGFTYDNWRYAIMLAAAGYGVFAPDSMAGGGDALGGAPLRHRSPTANLSSALARNASQFGWWCDDNVYSDDGCPAFTSADGFPLCYSSDASEIVRFPQPWRSYYARAYELRRRELLATVRWLEAAAPDSVWSSRLFLIGSSEGGKVASRFYDEALHARLSGLVLLQWSCEYNYYVPCARDAIICEGKCRASLPVLAMVAAQDPFFSATNADSVAATVARAAGYSLSGDCAAQLARQQTDAVSIVLPQHGTAEHGLTEAAPNLIRALLADFLHTPHLVTAMPTLRPEARLCRRGESEAMHARWSCVELGSEPLRPLDKDLPCSSWNTLYHAEYHGGLPPSSSTLQDGLQACSTLWQRPDEFERVAE